MASQTVRHDGVLSIYPDDPADLVGVLRGATSVGMSLRLAGTEWRAMLVLDELYLRRSYEGILLSWVPGGRGWAYSFGDVQAAKPLRHFSFFEYTPLEGVTTVREAMRAGEVMEELHG